MLFTYNSARVAGEHAPESNAQLSNKRGPSGAMITVLSKTPFMCRLFDLQALLRSSTGFGVVRKGADAGIMRHWANIMALYGTQFAHAPSPRHLRSCMQPLRCTEAPMSRSVPGRHFWHLICVCAT